MGAHRNNVGVLRLIFASLVILSHAPVMIDGTQAREPMMALFGTITLGQLCVDGFFLLSGYLITKSMVGTRSVPKYLERRMLRIYPAYILAFVLCSFVLGPLVGGPLPPVLSSIVNVMMLRTPIDHPGQFPGLAHYPGLNGAMWTISYEFRCYLLVAVFWSIGLLGRRGIVLALTAVGVAVAILGTFTLGDDLHHRLARVPHLVNLFGRPSETLRLTPIFMVGMCIFLFRDEIDRRLNGRVAAACAAVTLAALFAPHVADAVLTTFGAAALFWVAFKANLGAVQRVNDRWDVSYGVYLSGWPIANSIRWLVPGISPWTLAFAATALALAYGAASWWGLERWAKDLGRMWSRRSRRDLPAEPERPTGQPV